MREGRKSRITRVFPPSGGSPLNAKLLSKLGSKSNSFQCEELSAKANIKEYYNV